MPIPRLMVVAPACAALAGCGSGANVERDVCGAKASAIDAATRLHYRGAGDVVADVALLCGRLRDAKLTARVTGEGRDGLVLEVAPRDVEAAKAVAGTGLAGLYDWEANVVGPDGEPAPADPRVTGGAAAGRAAGLGHYDAVARAARRAADAGAESARAGSRFYAVDADARTVHGSGATRDLALASVPARARDATRVLEVKRGTLVARSGAGDRGWFVLRDDVAVRGSDIREPAQGVADGTGAPIVTFEFDADGARAFRELTRELAARGERLAGAGEAGAGANQHFAIVVDERIVSIPFVDFRASPDGIDPAAGGQIEGNFTIASARGLASVLRGGPLPVPLELVRETAS